MCIAYARSNVSWYAVQPLPCSMANPSSTADHPRAHAHKCTQATERMLQARNSIAHKHPLIARAIPVVAARRKRSALKITPQLRTLSPVTCRLLALPLARLQVCKAATQAVVCCGPTQVLATRHPRVLAATSCRRCTGAAEWALGGSAACWRTVNPRTHVNFAITRSGVGCSLLCVCATCGCGRCRCSGVMWS